MKKYILVSVITALFCRLSFAGPEKAYEINAPITSVKVYMNAAQIIHSQKIKVKSGLNKFVFIGLASNINEKNIGLRSIGASELLSLSLIKINDTTDMLTLNKEILSMIWKAKDSLINVEMEIMKIKYEIDALYLEKEMLVKNDDIISNGKQISVAELKLATDFYRERHKDINIELINKNRQLNQLKRNKIKMLKSAFNIENDQKQDMDVSIVIAELNNSGAEYSTDIELVYLAAEAGWIPDYYINAVNNNALRIEYRARVLNNTGIDWNNIKISLSTADPFQYYSAPDLEPFYISRYSRHNENKNLNQEKNKADVKTEEIFVPDREITFDISKLYFLRSGLKPNMIDVVKYDLNPDFLYRSAPKKEEQVYAIAKIKDWEKLNLVDGEASIYNNGVFLGKSYIRPSEIEEELELPLGVVDNIFVKYKLVSEFSSKKVLANEIVETLTYEIKLKNNSSTKVILEVMDQVPVSEESSVKTDIIEMTEGGEKDPLTGKIIWKQELNPGSEKPIKLKYSVTYPKRGGYLFRKSYHRARTRSKF